MFVSCIAEDNSINSMFRATKKDYHRSGFDRGHLAAAANHKWVIWVTV